MPVQTKACSVGRRPAFGNIYVRRQIIISRARRHCARIIPCRPFFGIMSGVNIVRTVFRTFADAVFMMRIGIIFLIHPFKLRAVGQFRQNYRYFFAASVIPKICVFRANMGKCWHTHNFKPNRHCKNKRNGFKNRLIYFGTIFHDNLRYAIFLKQCQQN